LITVKTKLYIIALAFITAGSPLHTQPITYPWYTVDGGGGKSTSGGITLQTSIGQPAILTGSSGGIDLQPGYLPGVLGLAGTNSIFDLLSEASWNMISVPLIVDDFRKTSLYPSAISKAFEYSGSYQIRDTLNLLGGYWIKFAATTPLEYAGKSISIDTVGVNNGWNMIGCLSYPVPTGHISLISPATISSPFFGYSGQSGYFPEDTLKPGRAYWLKVTNAGKLVMSVSSASSPPAIVSSSRANHIDAREQFTDGLKGMSVLTLRDALGRERTLYFASSAPGLDVNRFELPPSPPTFDVRYATNRLIEIGHPGNSNEVGIQISSAEYPVSIFWNAGENAALQIDRKLIPLSGSGNAQVPTAESVVRLKLSAAPNATLPAEFALSQNFPNPFNPATLIRYQLPARTHVTLKLYDVLGEEVAVLVDEVQGAGYKTVEWNAASNPSGVYFCRMQSGSFVATNKIILLR
jgi:hypothetical protein